MLFVIPTVKPRWTIQFYIAINIVLKLQKQNHEKQEEITMKWKDKGARNGVRPVHYDWCDWKLLTKKLFVC